MTKYRRYSIKQGTGRVVESETGRFVSYKDVRIHETTYGRFVENYFNMVEENALLKAEVKLLKQSASQDGERVGEGKGKGNGN